MHYTYSESNQTATIYLKVKAAAKNNKIEHFVYIQDKFILKLSITSAPENGKANIVIKKFLAKTWDLKQDQLELIKGLNQNLKLLAISSITKEQTEEIVAKYII